MIISDRLTKRYENYYYLQFCDKLNRLRLTHFAYIVHSNVDNILNHIHNVLIIYIIK